MNYSFLNYQLPEERIAQRPIGKGEERCLSRLLVYQASQIIDDNYFNLPNYCRAGDILVLNQSKVLPARFFISPDNYGEIEILLLQRCAATNLATRTEHWEVLARPMKRLKEGSSYQLGAGLFAKVQGRNAAGDKLIVELSSEDHNKTVLELIESLGAMPIPPYIRAGHSDGEDKETYQTVYARELGSVAAPTAGLHFTPLLIERLKGKGVELHYLTLHVGAASFLPIREQQVDSHQMSTEYYAVPESVEQAINKGKSAGRRVIVVGTTTLRALESFWRLAKEQRDDGQQATNIFIKPGFDFQVADVLVTNFHQPHSTHLLLVAAFVGAAEIAHVYQHALTGEYRFLSYGDGMFLERK